MVQGFVKHKEFSYLNKSKREQTYDFELSKLPLFGQRLQPNFEFPKRENFKPPVFSIEKMMDLKVRLCEVAFKRRAVGNELQGIQLKFTHEIETPLFQTIEGMKRELESVSINTQKRIERVGVLIEDEQWIRGIRMVDTDGRKLVNSIWLPKIDKNHRWIM